MNDSSNEFYSCWYMKRCYGLPVEWKKKMKILIRSFAYNFLVIFLLIIFVFFLFFSFILISSSSFSLDFCFSFSFVHSQRFLRFVVQFFILIFFFKSTLNFLYGLSSSCRHCLIHRVQSHALPTDPILPDKLKMHKEKK